mmetsp:Transcript_7936/g.15445  ORF Transcript_7936/g.15445 Transcript_7936/m.15445 type:complete len:118 (-) Transcript_7936:270-623(-)|eukprot:CAMPEP_0175080002 /NCGR_PEP_ID=MMETSP0052_2-20121109/25216_1 /TAXON_ID=51329 ORGANISM="Polytomella parva, Strain SAG 63-3" /NCGR_SAMPLE_ID=MMETSP0052_2 /ASSEMBLY_ACC=CAM_ASM_000194 /LENGTH=117 /DNA_ID=CAMNT_0016350555 /DNA_START=27 /DNA_END=380 /DNA_ORIENTATION=+
MSEYMGGNGQMPTAEQMQQQEEARQQAEDQRQSMLAAVMSNEARERLSRISLVKPEKARMVENMVIGAFKRGQISEKLSEERLLSMLEQLNDKESTAKPKITIQRRRPVFSDSEEDD